MSNNDIATKLQTSLSPAGKNWQRVQVTACSSMDIVAELFEVTERTLPRTQNWCPTVVVERVCETEQPLCLDENIKIWFAANDSTCREKPLILKSSLNASEIELDHAKGVAVIHLNPADTCCLSGRFHELFFVLTLSGAPDRILARAQGSLAIEPNPMGSMLLAMGN